MDSKEIEDAITLICSGDKYTFIGDTLFIIKKPTLIDKNFIDFIEQQAEKKAKERGLVTEKELAAVLNKTGAWTNEEEEKLKGLASDIEKIAAGIKDLDKEDIRNIKLAQKMGEAAHQAYNKLATKRASLFSATSDKILLEERLTAILYIGTYTEEGKYWKTWAAFQNEDNLDLINELRNEHLGSSFTTKQFREIARSNLWRFRWRAGQNNIGIFTRPIAQLTDDQQTLIYWSQFYDSIYEAYEKPPQSVIDNDEELDKWLDKENEKNKKKEEQKKVESGKGPVSKNIGRHGEIFLISNPGVMAWEGKDNTMIRPIEIPTPEDVHKLNDEDGKKFVKVQAEKIKKQGMADERHLRNDPILRHMIGGKQAGIAIDREGKKHTKWTKEY